MRIPVALAVTALFGVTPAAHAGSVSGTLDVTMTVADSCSLGSGGAGNNAVLDFGTQDAGVNSQPIDGSSSAGGDIILNCSIGIPAPQIEFTAGVNASGNQRRIMYASGAGEPSLIEYNLYIDSGRANPLIPMQKYDLVPDALSSGLAAGSNSITIYGQIPANQTLVNTGSGSYSDSVTFQITY